MVEASLCETQDPQTLDQELEKINAIISQTPKPSLCFEHKMENILVSKFDLSVLCVMCIVEHKPDSNYLIVFAKFIQEKREEMKDLFLKNVEIIKELNQLIEQTRN